MQIITLLLTIVAILTILSGIVVFAGATKKERTTNAWFLVATIGSALWVVSVGAFFALTTNDISAAVVWVSLIFIGSLLMIIALLGFASWNYRVGKFLTILMAVFGGILVYFVINYPNLFYSSISLNRNGDNVINFINGFSFWFYGGFIGIATILALIFLLYRTLHTHSKKNRGGYLIFLTGLSVNSLFSLSCDLILPLFGNCNWLWAGPFAICITMLAFYYAVLRYRTIILSNIWMKILSYVIIMASGALIYMLIFYVIFKALFHGANPSPEVLLLNFIMVLIMLLLMPVINEVSAVVRSLISTKQVDIAYVVRKLNKIAPQNVSAKDLASFLAEHMHFSFVGFVVNGRLYGSEKLSLSADEIVQISNLKPAKDSIWQNFNEPVSRIAAKQDINAIAELHNAKGQVFGQVIIGQPTGKKHFERRDLVQIEMIINLVAAVAESKLHMRK